MHPLAEAAAFGLFGLGEMFSGFRSELLKILRLFFNLDALLFFQVVNGVGIDLIDKRIRLSQQLFDVLL